MAHAVTMSAHPCLNGDAPAQPSPHTATLLVPFQKHQISQGPRYSVLHRYFKLIWERRRRTVFLSCPTPSTFSVAAPSGLGHMFVTDSISKYSWAALFPSPLCCPCFIFFYIPFPPPLHTPNISHACHTLHILLLCYEPTAGHGPKT